MSRKKKEEQIEDIPVDKVDLFLAENYKKLLVGLVVLLVLFIAGYAFKNLQASKKEMLANKLGQLELIMLMTKGEHDSMKDYLNMRNEYVDVAPYVNLKAAQTLVDMKKLDDAKEPVSGVTGPLKELADGLAFDAGLGNVDTAGYMGKGKLGSLWYYRAYMAAADADKKSILDAFESAYPENELLLQIKRWES